MILGLKKGQSNSGSFKKGEHRSRKTEFKKEQIPHNKGKKASPELRKINSIAQKKRWDRIGRQSKEVKNKKNREYQRKKRTDPNFRLKERERDRIYRLNPDVREKQNKQARESYAKNKDKMRKKNRAWYQKHRDKEIIRGKVYREKYKGTLEQRRLGIKLEALTHYSKIISNSDIPCCACCGENFSHKFLTLDHIKGKKSMGHKRGFGGEKIYRWAKRNDFPSGLQVLCWNCNAAKSNKGVCPHKE